jgi:hypothetical protein
MGEANHTIPRFAEVLRRLNMPPGVRIGGEHVGRSMRRYLTMFAVLLLTWLVINAFDVVWIYFCTIYLSLQHRWIADTFTIDIRSATNPNPRGGANKVYAGWKGYYVMSEVHIHGKVLHAHSF